MTTVPQPCVCTVVRKAARSLKRRYEDAVSASGVSITQFAILRAIERGGEVELSRLADELVMERTSLYRTLGPLIKNGAVVVAPGNKGRTKTVRLSVEGESLIERALPLWSRVQSNVVDQIGSERWQSLAQTLLEIPELLEAI